MIISAFISLVISLLLMSPSSNEDATKAKVLELAATSLEQHLDMNAFQYELSPRWIPRSLLLLGPESIESVSVLGNVEQYTRFNVIHKTRVGRKSTEIQLRIDAEQLVAVALERIKSRDHLSSNQFDLQWRSVKLGRDRFVTDIAFLEGKSIRRSLLAGQPVRVHEISSPVLVSPGDEISMIFDNGTIQLGLNCESRQSGSVGEEVQIYCQQTRKKYTAKVIGTGEVQWLRTN